MKGQGIRSCGQSLPLRCHRPAASGVGVFRRGGPSGSAWAWEAFMTEGCKILIVEDQMLIALDLERLIAGMDYQVCGIARTRTEALRLAEEHRPDLVVMDVRLADGSDGIAAARELRQRFGIAALLISGQIDGAQAEQAEASSFLRKPFEARQLRRAIADALRDRPEPQPEA